MWEHSDDRYVMECNLLNDAVDPGSLNMNESVVWVDGELFPISRAGIPVSDHSFLAGDGAFETFGVRYGVPLAVSRHLARLRRTLAGLDLKIEIDESRLVAGLGAVVEANPSCDWIRMTVSAGDGLIATERGETAPRIVMASGAYPATIDAVPVATVPWPRNERGVLAGLKTTSYAENTVALAYAKRQGAREAIFPNTRGELCEGSGSNIFVVLDSQLLTPALTSGCLQGITRELVTVVCDVEEATIPMEKLNEVEEAFLTSSTRGVLPISSVDGRPLPLGPLTTAARESYDALVDLNPDP